ncbi:hypothetical protein D3C85_950940 [compost metagenome]
MLEHQALDLWAVGHAADHQVQFTHMQLPEQMRTGPGGDTHHQSAVALMQAAQHFGHQQAFDGRQHADLDLGRRMRLAAQARHPIAQRLDARPGIAHEAHTGSGQLHPVLVPFEQPRLQQVFEFLEGLGNGRLADRHGIGSLGETALTGNFEKAQKVTEFDAGIQVHGASLSHGLGQYKLATPTP